MTWIALFVRSKFKLEIISVTLFALKNQVSVIALEPYT
jgi:hypothetical protein